MKNIQKPLLEFSYKTNLKNLMREVGFKSIKALSVQTEIGVTTLHNFSIGRANLPIEKLCKLLFALDCTFDELIEYTIVDNSDDSDLYDAFLEEASTAIVINDAETKQAFREFLEQRNKHQKKRVSSLQPTHHPHRLSFSNLKWLF